MAWAALAIGAVALVAFPILMARRPHPLVPLALFRRRRFATINLSTLLIYGAAYTMGYLFGLFLQNVLGYTATAAGLVSIPTVAADRPVLRAGRGTERADRVAAVPHRRPGADGRGPAVAGADPGDERALAVRARRPVDLPPAGLGR